MSPQSSAVPAGWYPDAHGVQRWWDGQQWAAHTGGPASTGQPSGGGGGSRGPIIAVVVALILVLVAAATVVIVLLSGGGSGDDPEEAAEQYVRAQVEADYLTRCQIATAEAREGLFEFDGGDSDTETFVVHLEKEDDQWRVAGVD